jgi:hypothetical protein
VKLGRDYIYFIMKVWIVGRQGRTLLNDFSQGLTQLKDLFWKYLGKLFGLDFRTNKNARQRISLQLSFALIASCVVAIFIAAPKSEAVVVEDCSAIGQLRNGGFERPAVTGTYPADTVTAAQQNSSNSVTDAVYGSVGDDYWNHLDASADTSTYRTSALVGSAGDARMYWNTTEASEQIELGTYVTPQSGSRFAELNASVQAGLFQDIPTVPGVTIRWSLAHRSRDGTPDTMRVYIGKPTNTVAQVRSSAARFNASAWGNNTTLQNNSATRTDSARAGLAMASASASGSTTQETDLEDGPTWGFWYGVYEETSTTTTNTRFMFESVDPVGGSGNLLDSITFGPVAACPIERTYNSPTDTQTVTIFDDTAGSFAIVPDESGSSESVTALTKVDGPGSATINSDGRTLRFIPNGSGTTDFRYTITYIANGITSTSDGTISITARDVFGAASCSPGSVESATSTTNGQTTVILTFKTPVQANTDNDSDHRSGTCTWTVPNGVNAVDYLVVGGGGGGSSGGGGGGGVVTSWRTVLANSEGTERLPARNPLAVTAGEEVNITVGGGGRPGWGGNDRCDYNGGNGGSHNACTVPTRTPLKGKDSVFGSITAEGGGFGGGSGQAAGGSGGSGGGSRFDDQAQSGAASASQVVGANSFGNIGGGSTASGGYRAGGGGGGAGTNAAVSSPPSNGNGGQGGIVRTISIAGGGGNGRVDSGSTSGGGGHGGRGVKSDIASLTAGTYAEYGCGGGGGINNNSNNVVSGGGGDRGCSSAGNGSSWATFLTGTTNYMWANSNNCANTNPVLSSPNCVNGQITSVQFNGTTVPTESFGGGGGGTDPEGNLAGSGGSGVVIIRYIVSSINCPNSSNNTNLTGPIACPYPITITAGAAVSTNYNLSYGDATNGYVSFPGGTTDTATVGTTIANGIDTVTVTYSNNGRLASFAISNANTALAGATYPLRYTIFSGSNTSTDYVLLRIVDPSQATPVVIPVDPRATFVDLSPVKVGGSQMTQVCYTPVDDDDTDGYGNVPSVETITARNTESYTVTTRIGRLRFTGTSANLQAAVSNIRVRKHSSDKYLLPSDTSRFIRVNVSNGTVGGNGSCTFGNESTLELRSISIQQTIVKPQVTLTRNNQ